jgi:hypothetical protein
MIYRIPYAFEMYGRIEVEANSLDEAYKKADDELINMSTTDLVANADYLEDSLEVDEEGLVLDKNGNIVE